jgi:probable F420-dependent oxidoreductase
MRYSLNGWGTLGTNPTGKDYILLARHMESLGFYGIWSADHLPIPTQFDRSQYPLPSGFPEGYNWPEPFVFLSAIAAATTSLRIGTAVTIVCLHPPVQQAQAIATLDYMSDGRFRYGIGLGWMEAEFDLVNVPFKDRGRRANEYVQLMKKLWSGSTEPFQGEFYSHGGAELKPLPVQKPHPPIIVGGDGLPAFKRLITLNANGLLCVDKTPTELRKDREVLRPMLEECGRDIASLQNSMVYQDAEYLIEHRELIAEFEGVGIEELVLAPGYSCVAEGMKKIEDIARKLIR